MLIAAGIRAPPTLLLGKFCTAVIFSGKQQNGDPTRDESSKTPDSNMGTPDSNMGTPDGDTVIV